MSVKDRKQSGFAAVNGTQLYYEVAGNGDPLVLIHGFSLDRRMWDAQFEVFARQYRVVRYDARGFGKSAVPDGAPYVHADDLKALLGHLQIARAHIVGLSMGGEIATEFALAYPDSVASLVVVDSALDGYRWSQEWDNAITPIWTMGRAGDVAAAKQLWLDHPLFAPARENPAVGVLLAQMVADYSGWHWLNRNPPREKATSALQRLEHIKAPTLVVLGERDLPDFHVIADTLHQRIPNASKVVIPRVGHMSPMENPQTFNTVVLDFLASV